ncbi:MAG: hypothetical protein E7260_06960 [Lachnospiraceae bacterium]|nr:hypothetical protein [Lachnospiraceae bacterium]
MAYYNLSKVVKMRRKALGVKREEFDAEGPTGMTVYRIEEGKHKTSERTYRSLTRSMGIEESTYQGILKTKKLNELQVTYEIAYLLWSKNDKNAEQKIESLKEKLDEKDMRNYQYLRYMEERIRYGKGEITAEEYEKVLEELLQLRVTKGYSVDMSSWPLHIKECQMVSALNNVLKKERKYEQQKELLIKLKTVLEHDYMNNENKELYQIIASVLWADMLGNIGAHREAIKMDEENLKQCEEKKEFRYLADVYYDLFWNYLMLKKQETLSAEEEERCRQCLLRAYYIDQAHGGLHPRYGQRLQECYPEELKQSL